MRRFLVVCFLVVAATAVGENEDLDVEWETFKANYGKSYSSEAEEQFRMTVYMNNKLKVAKHNEQYAEGKVSFQLAMNKFSDLLHEEFVRSRNGFRRIRPVKQASTYMEPANIGDVCFPQTVDWRKKGAVTPVKNQEQCGSCWAFSATGSLEGQHFLRTGKLVPLSEQNLVDCSDDFGNLGCSGGVMDDAFRYIKANGGIDTEKSYPYTGEDGQCVFDKSNVGATDTGFVDVQTGDETQLMKAVASVGPISVAIDASHLSFQFYAQGVYDEPECSSERFDHGVLAVGYGNLGGKDYWLVKNSWGADWGQEGYILMSRNKKNQCGIASNASYPLV
ncbi:procathepsin L-like [Ixodes scapularis]|uniref:procathepsin L-like n=1 Tax=Ixodes scapularis TaxID=6945 RepID=UPI001C37FD43|nr:procathepsin L-like [Ixodes scapularis]